MRVRQPNKKNMLTVKEFMSMYLDEEQLFAIVISTDDEDKYVIPAMWKTDYEEWDSSKNEYVCKPFHEYDDWDVDCWTIERNTVIIYIK